MTSPTSVSRACSGNCRSAAKADLVADSACADGKVCIHARAASLVGCDAEKAQRQIACAKEILFAAGGQACLDGKREGPRAAARGEPHL